MFFIVWGSRWYLPFQNILCIGAGRLSKWSNRKIRGQWQWLLLLRRWSRRMMDCIKGLLLLESKLMYKLRLRSRKKQKHLLLLNVELLNFLLLRLWITIAKISLRCRNRRKRNWIRVIFCVRRDHRINLFQWISLFVTSLWNFRKFMRLRKILEGK